MSDLVSLANYPLDTLPLLEQFLTNTSYATDTVVEEWLDLMHRKGTQFNQGWGDFFF